MGRGVWQHRIRARAGPARPRELSRVPVDTVSYSAQPPFINELDHLYARLSFSNAMAVFGGCLDEGGGTAYSGQYTNWPPPWSGAHESSASSRTPLWPLAHGSYMAQFRQEDLEGSDEPVTSAYESGQGLDSSPFAWSSSAAWAPSPSRDWSQ